MVLDPLIKFASDFFMHH